jgi:hypothetical protein
VRRVLVLTQSAAGGVVQVTVVQGSELHAPLVQPNMQEVSVGA